MESSRAVVNSVKRALRRFRELSLYSVSVSEVVDYVRDDTVGCSRDEVIEILLNMGYDIIDSTV